MVKKCFFHCLLFAAKNTMFELGIRTWIRKWPISWFFYQWRHNFTSQHVRQRHDVIFKDISCPIVHKTLPDVTSQYDVIMTLHSRDALPRRWLLQWFFHCLLFPAKKNVWRRCRFRVCFRWVWIDRDLTWIRRWPISWFVYQWRHVITS